jgi:hypothetical protein
VQGLSLTEAQAAVRDLYVAKKLLNTKIDRVLVTLLQPRQHKVLVFRPEAAGFPQQQSGPDLTKRGTGHLVDLPAYENDVLHALARTGGLPGLDTYDHVIIYRECFQDLQEGNMLLEQMKKGKGPMQFEHKVNTGMVTRIPLRVPPGAIPALRPEEVILHNGDVVALEGRNDQVFYTGGLLPPSVHVLPREFDLDVLSAMAYVRGPLMNGAFGGNNLSGALISPGIGSPSPRLVTVVRRTPNGGQVRINVDLHKAVTDPTERILVQKGDLLILQEMPGDALARYVTQTFLNFNLVWEVVHGRYVTGVLDFFAPERQAGRVGTGAFFPQP